MEHTMSAVDYTSLIQPDVDKTIRLLADHVATLSKQLAGLQPRLQTEQGNVTALEGRLERLKASAGKKLTADQNAYEQYRRDLKKLTADLATSTEMVRAFSVELVPGKTTELAAARLKLRQALGALVESSKPSCEATMAKLLDAVAQERDAFMDAFAKVYREYGVAFDGGAKGIPPVAPSPRLAEVKRYHHGRALAFSDPPPQRGTLARCPPMAQAINRTF
jgi:chromosome segregation ATPase